MAVVFLAGPLSGLIVQPLIGTFLIFTVLVFLNSSGVLADHSKSRFGRRRPFIMISAALCCAATLLFGYTRPIATLFSSPGSSSVRAPISFADIDVP